MALQRTPAGHLQSCWNWHSHRQYRGSPGEKNKKVGVHSTRQYYKAKFHEMHPSVPYGDAGLGTEKEQVKP